ncbi:MAG: hypothetical protein IJ540_06250 [Prevotella sp.]|nr:hypothetical protein [Prevotella sp.]
MSIVLLILVLVMQACLMWMSAYSKRKGENAADIDDNREKYYEAEKGKNLATKEDIEQITKSIEQIKSEISYENLRKHNAIQERERRFLNVLHIAENIQMQQALVLYSMYQVENAAVMTEAIKETNRLLVELNHEYRLIISSYKDTKALQNLTDLVKHLRPYATEICEAATNAVSYMTSWKGFMDMYVQNSDSAVRVLALQQATTNKNGLDQYRETIEFEERDNVANAISDYVVFLSRLFKVDFNINYEVPKIEPVNKQN